MRTIVWDVDDVLNELTAEWLRRAWVPAHPGAPAYGDLAENPPHRLLGVPLADYLESLDAFRRECYATLAPRPEIREWFDAHGCRCRHVALTAAPAALADLAAAWVIRHFGRWITTFAFVASPRRRGEPGVMAASKRDYLAWLGRGDVLVEDRAETLAAVSALGIRGVLVPQPWNERRAEPTAAALRDLTALVEADPTGSGGSESSC